MQRYLRTIVRRYIGRLSGAPETYTRCNTSEYAVSSPTARLPKANGRAAEFPTEMWDYRDEHGCWSIREHLVHIADSEANSYIRCRRLIAEPGEQLMAYDENAWSQSLFYSDQAVDDALALFRLLRSQTYTLIRSLPDEAWSDTCHHPENGDMSLDDWLEVYESYIPEHLEFM